MSKTPTNAPLFSIEETVFNVVEASEHLRISRAYFYKLIAEKKIRPAKLGKRTLIPGAEIKRFMASLQVG